MDYKLESDCLIIYNTKNISSTEFQKIIKNVKKVFITSQTSSDYNFLTPNVTDLTISIFTPYINNLKNLKSLEINFDCKSPFNLNNLPNSLKKLKIYSSIFNQPLDNLPINLEKLLIFPWCEFNQTIDQLPPNLKMLCLPQYFNQPLNNLPNQLEYLEIASTNAIFNHPLNKLPNSLLTLKINSGYKNQLNNLPPNLQSLYLADKGLFNNSLDFLPNIKKLSINGYFNQPLNLLPNSLHTLIIKTPYFQQSLTTLPANLDTLIYEKNTNIHSEIILPENLKKIELLCDTTNPIIKLPKSLIDITINKSILDKIKNYSDGNIKIWKKFSDFF